MVHFRRYGVVVSVKKGDGVQIGERIYVRYEHKSGDRIIRLRIFAPAQQRISRQPFVPEEWGYCEVEDDKQT